LLEHPTINTKEFQNGKKAEWNSGIRKEMPMAKNTLTTAFYQTEKNLKHPIPVRAYKDRIFRMIFIAPKPSIHTWSWKHWY